ncbi:MAG: ABC transporter permease, partial [Cyclobacteriaceae bacterium]
MVPDPPKYALRFLRWFCRDESIEEVEGDLIELYELQYTESPVRATRTFRWRVLRSFRPGLVKSPKILTHSNIKSMLQHNIKISYRNFLRYKSSFLINLFGLSTGLACVMLIWLWVADERSIDKFHENEAQLYEIMENVDQANGVITRYTTSGPMAKALQEEFPEVTHAVSATTRWDQQFNVSVGEHFVTSIPLYADPAFFEVFSFPLYEGDSESVLSDKKSIVISEQLAMGLFGTTKDVVGKIIKVEQEESYKVTGIMKDIPQNSSFRFDFVLSLEHYRDNNDWLGNWFNTAVMTYVLLEPDANINLFNEKVKDLVRDKTENQASHRTPFATKFSDLYLNNKFEEGQQAGGRIEYVRLFMIIAIFILVIACINFMNLSTARASRRLKEVGVKKALGARRSTLIWQFLSESVFIVSLSMIIAIVIVILLLPQFNTITEKELSLQFDYQLIIAALGILAVTGLLAGSYPALYLSGFKPIVVLKGKLNKQSGEQWARRGLVVFQYALSIVLMVAVYVVYLQIDYVQNENLGFDKENVITVEKNGKLEDVSNARTLMQEATRSGVIIQTGAMSHTMSGHEGGTYGVVWTDKDPEDRTEFERVAVDYGALDLLDIELRGGRFFSRDFATDSMQIIFNQAAIDHMQMEDPVGKTVKLWGQDRKIIGVTENFHFDSFREEVKPLFFFVVPSRSRVMMFKTAPGAEKEAIAILSALHEEMNPGFQFDYKFMDQNFDRLYATEQKVSTLSRYFAGLAIL